MQYLFGHNHAAKQSTKYNTYIWYGKTIIVESCNLCFFSQQYKTVTFEVLLDILRWVFKSNIVQIRAHLVSCRPQCTYKLTKCWLKREPWIVYKTYLITTVEYITWHCVEQINNAHDAETIPGMTHNTPQWHRFYGYSVTLSHSCDPVIKQTGTKNIVGQLSIENDSPKDMPFDRSVVRFMCRMNRCQFRYTRHILILVIISNIILQRCSGISRCCKTCIVVIILSQTSVSSSPMIVTSGCDAATRAR